MEINSTNFRVIVTVFVCFARSLIVVETVPVDNAKPNEVFTSCGDLAKDGYEGYKCTPASRCKDGYIVSDAIDDLLSAKSENSNLRNDELDASNYGCETVVRSEYDDYYYDNYDYDEDEQELICCRDPQFFGKGIVHEIYITSRIGNISGWIFYIFAPK